MKCDKKSNDFKTVLTTFKDTILEWVTSDLSGSGKGFDADKLDGKEGSEYALLNGNKEEVFSVATATTDNQAVNLKMLNNSNPPLNKLKKLQTFNIDYIKTHETGKSTYPQSIHIDQAENTLFVFGYKNSEHGEHLDIHKYSIDSREEIAYWDIPTIDKDGNTIEFMYGESAVVYNNNNNFIFTCKMADGSSRGIGDYSIVENNVTYTPLPVKTYSMIIPDIDGNIFGVENYTESNDYQLELVFYDLNKYTTNGAIEEVFRTVLHGISAEKIQDGFYARGKIYLGLGETQAGIQIFNTDGEQEDYMLFTANAINSVIGGDGETECEGIAPIVENGKIVPCGFYENYGDDGNDKSFALVKFGAKDGVELETTIPTVKGATAGEKLRIVTEQFSWESKNANPPADNIVDIFRYMIEKRISNLSIYVGGYDFYWDKPNNEKVKKYSTIHFTANNYYTLIAHSYSYSGGEQLVRYTCNANDFIVKKEVLLPLPFAHIEIAEHTTTADTIETIPINGFYRNSGEFEIVDNKIKFKQSGVYEIEVKLNHSKGNDTQDHTAISIYAGDNLIGAGNVVNTDTWYPAVAYATHEFDVGDEVHIESSGENGSGIWNKFTIKKIQE